MAIEVTAENASKYAANYVGEIDKLIETYYNWWETIEGDFDRQFGEDVAKSKDLASHIDASGVKAFANILTKTKTSAERLTNYYQKAGRRKDVRTVKSFSSVINKYLLAFEKADFFTPPPPGSKGNDTKQKNVWLLRINGDNWPLDELVQGENLHFHTQRPGIGPGDDYKLFEKVRPDDEGLAYAYGTSNAVVFAFRVVLGKHSDPHEGEIIRMTLIQKFSSPVPLALLRGKLTDENFREISNASIRLIQIDQTQFSLILSEVPSEEIKWSRFFTTPSIPDVYGDVSTADLKDHLGFKSDYEALASIIAYQKFQPPLAVGLFGNWGSGKSFFMNKLQSEIHRLSELKDTRYCERIVHINFNSWHYSDSNLWASLITKIFGDLEKSGKKEEKTQLETLFRNLNSTQELKVESEKELQKVKNEITLLRKQQKTIEGEIKNQTGNLKQMNVLDIGKEILKDDKVKKDIAALKDEFGFLQSEDFNQLKQQITDLSATRGKVTEIVKMLYSLRKGNFWIAIAIAALVFVGSAALVTQVELVKRVFGELKILIAPAMVILSQILVYLKRAAPQVDELHARLVSLKKKTDELEVKELNKFNVKRDEIQRKVANAEAMETTIKEKIKTLEIKAVEAQDEIDNIASGKKMIGFIEGRVSDQRYINSLGIISWVRKDFEELDFLLKQQYDAQKLKELNKTAVQNVFKVDRIILYIDDLDRCDFDVVVKVLEAIHLLLAFPLFVVIVGVDPRWMHNALQHKYPNFLKQDGKVSHPNGANGTEHNGIGLKNMSVNNLPKSGDSEPATSFDYLEKIFQIPIILKPVGQIAKRQLIEATLTDDYFEKKPDSSKAATKEPTNEEKQENSTESAAEENRTDSNSSNSAEQEENKTTQKAGGKDESPPVDSKPSEDLLKVGKEEIAFMKSIAFLVGDSPRTIKRFVNIYRIIRSHSQFSFVDKNRLEHYYAAMIILGVVSSHASRASSFFRAIEKENDITPFSRFLENYLENRPGDESFLASLIGQNGDQSTLDLIRPVKMIKFKTNLDLICRFSFRGILDIQPAAAEGTPNHQQAPQSAKIKSAT